MCSWLAVITVSLVGEIVDFMWENNKINHPERWVAVTGCLLITVSPTGENN